METIETIRNRRSVRKFSGEEISQSDISLLKEALLRSPSSRNRNPWKFYFVRNKELLQKLSICKPDGAQFVADADLAVVVCGDENVCDVWIEDASIASVVLQLAAQSLGLGSCWVQIRNRKYDDAVFSQDYIKNLLGIENNLQILSIIALGHPAQTPKPREYGELQFDKIKDIL